MNEKYAQFSTKSQAAGVEGVRAHEVVPCAVTTDLHDETGEVALATGESCQFVPTSADTPARRGQSRAEHVLDMDEVSDLTDRTLERGRFAQPVDSGPHKIGMGIAHLVGRTSARSHVAEHGLPLEPVFDPGGSRPDRAGRASNHGGERTGVHWLMRPHGERHHRDLARPTWQAEPVTTPPSESWPDLVEVPIQGERVLAVLEENGHEAYIAGGAVRDLLRGVPLVDIDIATSARPDEVEELMEASGLTTWDVGAAFGTIGVRVAGETIEVTTFRSEVYTAGSRKPDVEWSTSAEEDMLRRDLSINSMFLDRSGRVVDLFGGRDDLGAGLIRATGDPDRAFTDDPLRIVRAARFAAGLGFDIVDATRASAIANAHLVAQVAPERILAEIDKAMTSGAGAAFAARCRELGCEVTVFRGLPSEVITLDDPLAAWTQLAAGVPESERLPALNAMRVSRAHRQSVSATAGLVDWIDTLDSAPLREPLDVALDLVQSARRLGRKVTDTAVTVSSTPPRHRPAPYDGLWCRQVLEAAEDLVEFDLGVDGAAVAAAGFEGPAIGARIAELERQALRTLLAPRLDQDPA